jgi:hypothetical protein
MEIKEEVLFRVCLENAKISEGWEVRKTVYYEREITYSLIPDYVIYEEY